MARDGNGYIVFNSERVYSASRVLKMLENWRVLEEKRAEDGVNVLYVLAKV